MEDEEETPQHPCGDFKPGSIKQIDLKNFLTYQNVTIKPGPRLNMVCGANGTGKSTILNAICLGLGGDPKLLGRAEDVRDYVMHGKDKATIEIQLVEGGTIKRLIDKTKGSAKGNGRGASQFWINGEKASIQEVKAHVEALHISIGNLCTFLPQDKVGSFSAINPQELLLETEKTMGDVYSDHQKLIAAEKELNDGGKKVKEYEEKLKKLKHDIQQLERAKELVEEREAAEKQADLLGKKLLWMQFDALREKVLELKEQRKVCKDKVLAGRDKQRPYEEQVAALTSQLKESTAKKRQLNDKVSKCHEEMDKQKKKHERHDDSIEADIMELGRVDGERQKKEQELAKHEERVNKVEQQLAEPDIPTLEEVQKEIDEATEKYRACNKQYKQAQRESQQLRARHQDMEDRAKRGAQKVQQLSDEKKQRKDKIFAAFPELRSISKWLDDNKTRFRRPVTGPIACEITPKSPEAAALLENAIQKSTLKSFVVETKEDYDLVYKSIRTEKNLAINIIIVENGRLKAVQRPMSDAKFQTLKDDHGITSYLDEVFDAPDVVRQALNDWAGLSKILVGSDKTDRNRDRMIEFISKPDPALNQQRKQGFTFFAPDGRNIQKYSGIVSRYSGHISQRQDLVQLPRIMKPGVDPALKEAAEKDLAEVHREVNAFRPKMEEAQKKLAKLEEQTQEAHGDAQAGKKRKEYVVGLQRKLENAVHKRDKAKQALAEAGDDKAAKQAIVETIKNKLASQITACEKHAAEQAKMMEYTMKMAGLEANTSKATAELQSATNALNEIKQENQQCEAEATRLSQEYAKLRKRAEEKGKEANEKAPIKNGDQELPLKGQLEEIEYDTLEEVQLALEEAHKAARLIESNPGAIAQWEHCKNAIAATEEKLQDYQGNKDQKLKEIKRMQRQWEEGLTDSLAQVNQRFAVYMSEMDFTGEVRLSKGATEGQGAEEADLRDYEKWGIEILVSFRQGTKSQVLSAHRHSGGERSVSTIMYLMALQDLMVAPFRSVDEINQGLDERNERLVFRRIVKNSCKPPPEGGDPTDHSGQYFLITPKLLPNLVDMENEGTTVLFVLNGPHLGNCDWNVDTWIDLYKKRGREGQSGNKGHQDDDEEEADTENVMNSPPRGRKKSRR